MQAASHHAAVPAYRAPSRYVWAPDKSCSSPGVLLQLHLSPAIAHPALPFYTAAPSSPAVEPLRCAPPYLRTPMNMGQAASVPRPSATHGNRTASLATTATVYVPPVPFTSSDQRAFTLACSPMQLKQLKYALA